MREPGPAGAAVVVAGEVESQPCAATLHVLLKGAALRSLVRRIVEPYDKLIVLEICSVQVVPVRGDMPVEVIALCLISKEGHCLARKVQVIGFGLHRIEGEHVELWLRRLRPCRARKPDNKEKCRQSPHQECAAHRMEL